MHHRNITKVIDRPKIEMGPGHALRTVLEPGHWEEYDPFLLLNEDWFRPGTFGDHPHRGFETVTFVLEGSLAHRDNRGNSGVLGPGDAQWMTAGQGIIHSEEPASDEVHSLQLWLNLPSSLKMTEPRYRDLRGKEMPLRKEKGATLRVFSGASAGVKADTPNHVPTTMVEMNLEAGATVSQNLPGDQNGFIYVIAGKGQFGVEKTPAHAGQAVWLSHPPDSDLSEITISSGETLHAMLWAGERIREPVVQYGPFVMNTNEQIRKAFVDFQSGRF